MWTYFFNSSEDPWEHFSSNTFTEIAGELGLKIFLAFLRSNWTADSLICCIARCGVVDVFVIFEGMLTFVEISKKLQKKFSPPAKW